MEHHRMFIKSIKQEPDPVYGQSPDILTLTTKGKQRLVKHRGRQKDAIRLTWGRMIRKDRKHRIHTITCQICLSRHWISQGYDIVAYDNYFNKVTTGGSTRAETALQIKNITVVPDSLIHIKKDDQSYLYALEMHNGWDVKRIVNDQLWSVHTNLIASGRVGERYGVEADNRVLSVYEHKRCMHTAMERVGIDSRFRFLKHYFLFMWIGDLYN